LPHLEAADSESVDELVQEGNAFEADVVAGVERANELTTLTSRKFAGTRCRRTMFLAKYLDKE
jgi:hypothetical protein